MGEVVVCQMIIGIVLNRLLLLSWSFLGKVIHYPLSIIAYPIQGCRGHRVRVRLYNSDSVGQEPFFVFKMLTSGQANTVHGCLQTSLCVFGWMRGRAHWIKVTSWQKESAHSGQTKSKQKSWSLTVNSEKLISSPDVSSTCTPGRETRFHTIRCHYI